MTLLVSSWSATRNGCGTSGTAKPKNSPPTSLRAPREGPKTTMGRVGPSLLKTLNTRG